MNIHRLSEQEVERVLDAMVRAAAENGLANSTVARELAANAMQVLMDDDDPKPTSTLAEMIDHRRFHWPSYFKSFTGSARTLATALIHAFKETTP